MDMRVRIHVPTALQTVTPACIPGQQAIMAPVTYLDVLHESSCLYRASMTIKTLYYPIDAQIYNS